MGNHFAVQITPDGLTMYAQHNGAVSGAFINVMDSQILVIMRFYCRVVRLERIVLQSFEAAIRCAQNFHIDRSLGLDIHCDIIGPMFNTHAHL
jgi:hypothetical protein